MLLKEKRNNCPQRTKTPFNYRVITESGTKPRYNKFTNAPKCLRYALSHL
jgi:hypothetical protein